MILQKIESPILQNKILKNFPKIELSYENYIHNKVLTNEDGDVFLAIPKGKKYFLLFYDDCNYFIFLELHNNKNDKNDKNDKNQISNIYHLSSSKNIFIDSNKPPSTIFYGTLIYNQNNNNNDSNNNQNSSYFCIEDVYYYKDKNVKHFLFLNKLKLMSEFFDTYKNYNQTNYNQTIKLRLPFLSTNVKELYDFHNSQIISVSPYKVHHIVYYNYKKKYKSTTGITPHHKLSIRDPPCDTHSNLLFASQSGFLSTTGTGLNSRIFIVKPEIQNDVYYLYSYDNNLKKEVFHDIAYIPSYKTSVMMNTIFRKIKENTNLDLLEESDDEEEFENEDPDKFVNLEKSCYMKCVYNNKFKKWVPLCIHNGGYPQ